VDEKSTTSGDARSGEKYRSWRNPADVSNDNSLFGKAAHIAFIKDVLQKHGHAERSADTPVRLSSSRLRRHFNIAGKSARAPLD
jgi:hypothetical protein